MERSLDQKTVDRLRKLNPGHFYESEQEVRAEIEEFRRSRGLPPIQYAYEPPLCPNWHEDYPELLEKYKGKPIHQLMALARLTRRIAKLEQMWEEHNAKHDW